MSVKITKEIISTSLNLLQKEELVKMLTEASLELLTHKDKIDELEKKLKERDSQILSILKR